MHATDEPFAPIEVYLSSLRSTSFSSLPLPTRFISLCMPSNWMLIARPVWQPFVAHIVVQIRNEILSPFSCGFRVHRCPVYLLFEGDRIYTRTFLLLYVYHHTEMLQSKCVIILCVWENIVRAAFEIFFNKL